MTTPSRAIPWSSSLCYIWIFVCLIQLIAPIRSGCPDPGLLYPCSCHHSIFGTHVFCGGDSHINLDNIFESLSAGIIDEKKHFTHLTIGNIAVHEIRDNTFRDITFEAILIENTRNLSIIHRNAFTETNWYTKSFVIRNCPNLRTSAEDLFFILSKMKNLESLVIENINLTEIPGNAFQPINGYQGRLQNITIMGRKLRKLGSNSFRYLTGLKNISLVNTSMDSVPENAFAFERPSNTSLSVSLANNSFLTAASFTKNSLSHVWRTIELSGIAATVLSEEVFVPFLDSNEQNSLSITGQRFDCHNCYNFWIRRNSAYNSRIFGIRCANGYPLMHNNNFINCKH